MKTILQKLIHESLLSAIYSWKLRITKKVANLWLAWNLDCYSGGIMNSLSLSLNHLTQLANLMLFFPYSHFMYFSHISFPSFAWRRTESIWHILQQFINTANAGKINVRWKMFEGANPYSRKIYVQAFPFSTRSRSSIFWRGKIECPCFLANSCACWIQVVAE